VYGLALLVPRSTSLDDSRVRSGRVVDHALSDVVAGDEEGGLRTITLHGDRQKKNSGAKNQKITHLELVKQVIGVEIWPIVKGNSDLSGIHTVIDAISGDEHIAKLRPWYRGGVDSRRLSVLHT
jgi:hypothetical protein